MGNQIIKQPDGRFAIFNSGTDTIIIYDASYDEIVEYFARRAALDAERSVRVILGYVQDGEPRRAYAQFTLSWEQALRTDQERGGDAWRQFDPIPHSE